MLKPSNHRQTRESHWKAATRLAAAGLALLWLAGCAGKGESMAVELRAAPLASSAGGPASPTAPPTGDLTVAVAAFDDTGLAQGRLGSRTHLWGGTSYFDLTGGRPGEVVARVVADTLKQRGWRVEKVGGDGTAQVTISGKILELSVNAKSSFGSTDIRAVSKLAVEAVNQADGSKVRMTLGGEGAQTVFWFDPEDAQGLLGETVAGSLNKLIANTKVEGGLLRLK